MSNIIYISCSYLIDSALFQTTKRYSVFRSNKFRLSAAVIIKELCYFWSTDFHGPGPWNFRKVDQKYIECCDMWCR